MEFKSFYQRIVGEFGVYGFRSDQEKKELELASKLLEGFDNSSESILDCQIVCLARLKSADLNEFIELNPGAASRCIELFNENGLVFIFDALNTNNNLAPEFVELLAQRIFPGDYVDLDDYPAAIRILSCHAPNNDTAHQALCDYMTTGYLEANILAAQAVIANDGNLARFVDYYSLILKTYINDTYHRQDEEDLEKMLEIVLQALEKIDNIEEFAENLIEIAQSPCNHSTRAQALTLLQKTNYSEALMKQLMLSVKREKNPEVQELAQKTGRELFVKAVLSESTGTISALPEWFATDPQNFALITLKEAFGLYLNRLIIDENGLYLSDSNQKLSTLAQLIKQFNAEIKDKPEQELTTRQKNIKKLLEQEYCQSEIEQHQQNLNALNNNRKNLEDGLFQS
jgi:hypothetical protein